MSAGEESPNWNRYRGYLHLVGAMDLDAALMGKLDLSGIVQETLIEAHLGQNQRRCEGEAAWLAWLRQILVRNLQDEIRRLKCAKNDVKRELSLDDSALCLRTQLAATDTSPSQRAVHSEQLLRLADAVQELSGEQQIAVIRHYLQGASLAELSAELQRSKEAVAGLLRRGLAKLRELLAEC